MDDLYTAVLHDVKNQLAELALRLGKRGDAQQEMLVAMNAARQLSEMLLVHRDAADMLWLNADTVSPADFLAILAAEYRELFPDVAIYVDAEGAPACGFFDDMLVRMAFGNALHNACRFAGSTVRLAAYEQDSMLVLEVSDDGPGFPDSVLDSAGKLPAAASTSGTGLGLYLARRIAERHQLQGRQGSIALSNAGGGRFCMRLP
ncbi:sensor-type histidine kinase PrrB [mine drainage metagenome]|uniref:histidine kinase n=1 Tax=mine drainage metagenome TaxID=410659 RepID=A0A1J5Q5F2_9ZZZZ